MAGHSSTAGARLSMEGGTARYGRVRREKPRLGRVMKLLRLTVSRTQVPSHPVVVRKNQNRR